MEPIHPDEMVPDTKYKMEDPAAVSFIKVMNRLDICEEDYKSLSIFQRYKTVTFKRVAYKHKGVWHYQFDVDGQKRFFNENDTFYKEA